MQAFCNAKSREGWGGVVGGWRNHKQSPKILFADWVLQKLGCLYYKSLENSLTADILSFRILFLRCSHYHIPLPPVPGVVVVVVVVVVVGSNLAAPDFHVVCSQ